MCRELFEWLKTTASTLEEPESEDDDEDASGDEADEPAAPAEPTTAEQHGDTSPVVEWAIVMAIARSAAGTANPDTLNALLANVTRSANLPITVDRTGFADALAALYRDCGPRMLAEKLGALMAGHVELDPAAALEPRFQRHVKRQALHAAVPLATAATVLALQAREDVSEVIGVDCRTEDEFEVISLVSQIRFFSLSGGRGVQIGLRGHSVKESTEHGAQQQRRLCRRAPSSRAS